MGSKVSCVWAFADINSEIVWSYSFSHDARSGHTIALGCHPIITLKSPEVRICPKLAMSTVTGNCTTMLPRRSDRPARPIGTYGRRASESSCNVGGSSNMGWNGVFVGSAHSKRCEPFQKLFFRTWFNGTTPVESGGTNCLGMGTRSPTCSGSPDNCQALDAQRLSNAETSSVIGFTYLFIPKIQSFRDFSLMRCGLR